MSTDRQGMVTTIEKEYGLNSPKIANAMMKIPREKFAPNRFREFAYDDCPIDIGYGQTMSQPYTVAFMTHLATEIPDLKYQRSNKLNKTLRKSKVLEIGTGSGYQAAILSYFFDEIYSIEIVPQLAKQAGKTLKRLGYKNVLVKTGSGELGWKEKSPFDVIMITAGVEEVPKELFRQLKLKGVLVAPVGGGRDKIMTRFRPDLRGRARYTKEEFGAFHFVPFVKEN